MQPPEIIICNNQNFISIIIITYIAINTVFTDVRRVVVGQKNSKAWFPL